MKLFIVVPEPIVVVDRSFETAAWSVTLTLDAGEYEMRPPERRYGQHPDYDPRLHEGWWGRVPGTVVEDYFASLWGGVPISPYDRFKNAGSRDRSYPVHTYGYHFKDSDVQEVFDSHWNQETRDMDRTLIYRIEKRT
jgi:hypothetical protein